MACLSSIRVGVRQGSFWFEFCQVATGKCPAAQISAPTTEDVEVFTSTTTKRSICKTGVHLRYHTTTEYHELMVEQKKELAEWRSNNLGAKTGKLQKYNGKGHCNNKKSISATIARDVKKAFAAQPKSSCGQHNNEPDDQATTNAEKYITSVVHMMVAKMQAAGEKTEQSKPKVTLQSILKQAKNYASLTMSGHASFLIFF